MTQQKKILVLEGDGIGQEIIPASLPILHYLQGQGCNYQIDHGLIGGTAYDKTGKPLPEETLKKAKAADTVLLGAVGGPKWDELDFALKPERGLLGIRKELDLFANLRPIRLFPELADASPLKPEIISGLDILILRELTSGIYFGSPRGIFDDENNKRYGINTYYYHEDEIRRLVKKGFELARSRNKKLCSVDKANVLETTILWREIVEEEKQHFPDVELNHLYVDNASMQLCINPKQFDVVITGNMFGDILSDQASMLTGSIGMLPSASLNASNQGMYEPIHGSAPDIAGQNKANPLATILSIAMMLRYSLQQSNWADKLELAVSQVLQQGYRCLDIASQEQDKASIQKLLGTKEMGAVVLGELQRL